MVLYKNFIAKPLALYRTVSTDLDCTVKSDPQKSRTPRILDASNPMG